MYIKIGLFFFTLNAYMNAKKNFGLYLKNKPLNKGKSIKSEKFIYKKHLFFTT